MPNGSLILHTLYYLLQMEYITPIIVLSLLFALIFSLIRR